VAVDRILIEGFKSIEKCDLELRSLNVLIGSNGAGKSNFIGAFKLLNEVAGRTLRSFVASSGGAESLLHFGRKNTASIYIRVRVDKNGYAARLSPDAEDNLYFERETAYFYGHGRDKKPFDEDLGSGHQESKLHGRGKTPSYVLAAMRTWRLYHFHDTSGSAKVKSTSDVNDNASLRPDASNLAAFLYRLQRESEDSYHQIVNTVRLVAPFFADFVLRPNPLNTDKIRLEWSEVGSDAYLNAHALSDGTLRFMCLTTLLLQPEVPKTILIDEPELGLHPAAIRTLTDLFRVASSRTQVIVSTQSVPLVNQLAPDDLIVVERGTAGSSFRRLDATELDAWVGEYGLGDLWEKNVIGGRP
jgi:predicted ATPase